MITLLAIGGIPSVEASLDTWTSIFFVVSIFGLFFSSLFFLKGRHRLPSVWPIPVMIFGYSIVLFQYALFWTNYIKIFPFLHFTLGAWFLAFGPLMYYYTARFCGLSVKRGFYHFVPALVCLLLAFLFYLRFFNITFFDKDSLWLVALKLIGNPWLAVFSMTCYLFVSVRIWNRFKGQSTQKIVNVWMRWLHAAFLCFVLSYASYFVLVQFPFFNITWDYGIAVGMSLSIFTIGLFVYYEPAIFNGEINWLTAEKTELRFSDENSRQFYDRMVSVIRDEELFLNGDLRLAHLSEKTGLSIHDASRIINQHSGKNFNQFINDFRVERAQELLLSTDLSVKEICFVSGFNSKVTFYAAFKLKTNQTPVEYRKSEGSHS